MKLKEKRGERFDQARSVHDQDSCWLSPKDLTQRERASGPVTTQVRPANIPTRPRPSTGTEEAEHLKRNPAFSLPECGIAPNTSRMYLSDASLREKVFLPGSTFPGCSFREMPLVAHPENISLFFCGLALVTWSSLAMDVRFRGVPPGSRSSPTVFPPYRRIKDDKEKPTRKRDHFSV